MPEKYQVSITNTHNLAKPGEVSLQVDWSEGKKEIKERTLYPSIQQMMSQVNREKFSMNLAAWGGNGSLFIGMFLPMVAIANRKILENNINIFSGGLLVGIVAGLAIGVGAVLGIYASEKLDKVSVIQKQIRQVVRTDYTISPTGESFLQRIRSGFRF